MSLLALDHVSLVLVEEDEGVGDEVISLQLAQGHIHIVVNV